MGEMKLAGYGAVNLNVDAASQNGKNQSTKNVQAEFSTMLGTTSNTSKNQDLSNYQTVEQTVSQNKTDQKKFYQCTDKKINQQSSTEITDEKMAEVSDKVEEFSDKVKDELKEKLGVSDEDIENAMETLGYQYTDLLDPSNLTQLVQQLTGCDDSLQLLMNEGFQQIMQDVEQFGTDLLEQLGMSMDELKQACSQILNVTDETDGADLVLESEVAEDAMGVTENQPADTDQSEIQQNNTVNDKTMQTAEMTTHTETGQVTQTAQQDGTVQQNVEQPEHTESQGSESDVDVNETVDPITDTIQTSTTDSEQEDTTGEETEAQTQTGAQELTDSTTEDTGTKTEFLAHTQVLDKNEDETVQTDHSTLQNLTNNTAEISVAPTESTYQATQTVDVQSIIEQVTEYAKTLISSDGTTISMQLNPENLGKLYLQVAYKEGALTAQLAAQNETVKEALENQVAQLKENMNQQGIKVEAIEVTVASHEFEKNLEENQQQSQQQAEEQEERSSQGRRNLNLSDMDIQGILADLSEEENLTAKIMTENGNTVDLTA